MKNITTELALDGAIIMDQMDHELHQYFSCGLQIMLAKSTPSSQLKASGMCSMQYLCEINLNAIIYYLLRSCKGSSKDCQSPDPVELKMEVVSLGPRAFLIEDFLSGFEAEAIIEAANATLKESSVGNKEGGGTRKSETRTSRNSWVNRKTNYITESLFLRAADLLNIDERLLNNNENAEDMQVVHYVNGQKYDSHHDWGVSGYPESRFITLLLYLTDMAHPQAGGETSFPKGANGGGFKVEPKKGSAVLFYDLLEDGNGDDLALHAALPVWEGEKWLANFWVWDPKRK